MQIHTIEIKTDAGIRTLVAYGGPFHRGPMVSQAQLEMSGGWVESIPGLIMIDCPFDLAPPICVAPPLPPIPPPRAPGRAFSRARGFSLAPRRPGYRRR